MTSTVDDLVLDFYDQLFTGIFSTPFKKIISDRRKSKKVIRQVEDAADAASKSLTRFFEYQKLDESQATAILDCFKQIADLLTIEDVANSNIPTEEIVGDLLTKLPYPDQLQETHAAVYRLALHTIIQVLMQVAQVMAEWQKLNFAETFELIRSVVNRLNEISRQVEAQGKFGQQNSDYAPRTSTADRDYELLHRDYILQQFHKVEAGTVRMTTNLDVDLRELFVMPNVRVRKSTLEAEDAEDAEDAINLDSISLMNLEAARQRYSKTHYSGTFITDSEANTEESKKEGITAFEQVTNSKYPFNVLVGLPGAGKSTFLEWLQVKIASVEETYILNGEQAIPLLIKIRQLDPLNLPQGSALIEKATASKDRAIVMPAGWIDRQMAAGRVLFMLDGLDEIEPELRDKYLIPWLLRLKETYPKCDYLISSRPVGYPFGMLKKYKFVESELVDFNPEQIKTYTRHWCTAVRLARNELDAAARREGAIDGDKIAKDIQQSPYIRDLARNPLMLSAICLVYYFERGKLPDDRAILYKLCVEGLLHHWDSRRGIHSEFSFSEKLRACREVALAMQADDSAEYESDQVLAIFTDVLQDAARASKLLEHIRYRTGLLLERRPNVFGFAHLTFQEYLAARAIHEGNKQGITPQQLVTEPDDSRWREVIALYAGVTTTPAVRELIEGLIIQEDTILLGEVLADVYFATNEDLKQDAELRKRVIKRIVITPAESSVELLEKFNKNEVINIANHSLGKIQSFIAVSNCFIWLRHNSNYIDFGLLKQKLEVLHILNSNQIAEIVFIVHRYGSDSLLNKIANMPNIYEFKGSEFISSRSYIVQAEVTLIALSERLAFYRNDNLYSGFELALIATLTAITKINKLNKFIANDIYEMAYRIIQKSSIMPKLNKKDIVLNLFINLDSRIKFKHTKDQIEFVDHDKNPIQIMQKYFDEQKLLENS